MIKCASQLVLFASIPAVLDLPLLLLFAILIVSGIVVAGTIVAGIIVAGPGLIFFLLIYPWDRLFESFLLLSPMVSLFVIRANLQRSPQSLTFLNLGIGHGVHLVLLKLSSRHVGLFPRVHFGKKLLP